MSQAWRQEVKTAKARKDNAMAQEAKARSAIESGGKTIYREKHSAASLSTRRRRMARWTRDDGDQWDWQQRHNDAWWPQAVIAESIDPGTLATEQSCKSLER